MAEIRVVLDAMPAVLAAIVRDVARGVPGTIVADSVAPDALIGVVTALKPDVVVISSATLQAGDATVLDQLLCGGGRRVRVVALSPDGRDARLHDLRAHVTELADVSPQALQAAMRPEEADHG